MSPHPLIRLAAEAIAAHLSGRGPIERPEAPGDDSPWSLKPAGLFVCLKRRGDLRGCIGTIEPSRDSLAAEVIENAVGAATRDPRFPPVRPEELPELVISIHVLGPHERVSGPEELDPSRYGLIVRAGARRGVLLPDVEGITTAAQQIETARAKAGIGPREPVELFRFDATKYE